MSGCTKKRDDTRLPFCLEYLFDFDDARHFFDERALNAGFQCDGRRRAAAASTHQTEFDNAFFYIDEFYVTAVAKQERA